MKVALRKFSVEKVPRLSMFLYLIVRKVEIGRVAKKVYLVGKTNLETTQLNLRMTHNESFEKQMNRKIIKCILRMAHL